MESDPFRRLPKAELHRHLEGSLRMETAFDTARRRGIEVPGRTLAEFAAAVGMRDGPPGFRAFLEKFKILHALYADEEATRRFAREALDDAAAENVRYLELRYGPAHIARRTGAGIRDVARWMREEAAEAGRRRGIRVVLLATLLRDSGPALNAGVVGDLAPGDVAGLDLAGDEENFPPEDFREVFAEGRRKGFRATIHAGEAGPPEGIRAAVEILGADRIGHGIAAARDPAVAALLRERGIALEVCPTSNVRTACVPSLADHPFPALFRSGVPVTLNSDDPVLCGATLSDEIREAAGRWRLSPGDLWTIQKNALRAAFIPEAEKKTLAGSFRPAWAGLSA